MNLFFLSLKVACFNLVEYVKVVFKYYRFSKFRKSDLSLLWEYLWQNPFSIAKRFHQKRGDEEIYVYGETPLTSWDQICRHAQITKKDTVFDLGCGRARTLFWLEGVRGVKGVGIDEIPFFIEQASRVKSKYHLDKLKFLHEDLIQADFSSGTVFYIYNNFLSDDVLTVIAEKIADLPHPAKVISVSFPITDYSENFQVVDVFNVIFPWGVAEVYLSSTI